MYADILRNQVAELEAESDALLAETDAITTDETRSLEPADEARLTEIVERGKAIVADIAAKTERIATLDTISARSDNAAKRAPVTKTVTPTDIRSIGRLGDYEARSAAVTAVERSRRFAKDDHKSNLVNLIERDGRTGAAAARMTLVTGSDEYGSAWLKYMTGNHFAMSEGERSALAAGFDQYSQDEMRSMTSGTGSSGGYLVPVYIDPTMIITGAGSTNPFRQLATVKTIGPAFGGWYGATAAQVTAAWTSEGSAAPDNTPTVTQPNIPVYMAEAFVDVSFQGFEDIADLAADVQALFADAKTNLEAVAHATATGSGTPTGVSYAVGAVTASRVSPATGGTLAIGDPFLVSNALPERFAESTSLAWAGSQTVLNKIRTLAMGQNSANSVWTDAAVGMPPTLLGDRVVRAGSMSASLTTGQDVLLYGDFSRYYIVDRIGFTTEFIPNLFDTSTGRPVAKRGWLAHWRSGANVVDVNAFRQLRL